MTNFIDKIRVQQMSPDGNFHYEAVSGENGKTLFTSETFSTLGNALNSVGKLIDQLRDPVEVEVVRAPRPKLDTTAKK